MTDKRNTDPTRDSILELIEAEQDGTKRAHLMIMLRILDSLERVSSTAVKIETDLALHKAEFDLYKSKFEVFESAGNALVNKGKGGIWITLILLGFLQSIVIYNLKEFSDALKDVTAITQQNRLNIAVIAGRTTNNYNNLESNNQQR